MNPLARLCIGVVFCLGLLGWSGSHSALLAQNPQVTSANPPAAAQGTINLNVVIGGSGFKKGAQAQWFITGTTNPGGVVVNSTAFNSSSQLTANITVSDTADIASFDVMVYSGGRTGKGTGLFQVTQKGTPTGCTTLGTPNGYTLVANLNYLNASSTPQYGPEFGYGVRVSPVVLSAGTQQRTVLIAAVGSTNGVGGKLEIFFLDPATGQVLDGQSLLPGSPVQPHLSLLIDNDNIGVHRIEAGDVNADGLPDFALGRVNMNTAYVAMASMNSSGVVSYSLVQLPTPVSNPGKFGSSLAVSNMDGQLGDEVAVGAEGGPQAGTGQPGQPGVVYAYKFNSGNGRFDLIGSLTDPLPNTKKSDDYFGRSVAIGDVTGDGAPDLIVGAPNASVGSTTGAGRVFVFPCPFCSVNYYTMTTGVANDKLGAQVAAGNVNGSPDVIAAGNTRVLIFSGPISSSLQAPTLTFNPDPRLNNPGPVFSFEAADMLATGQTEILMGVTNANNSTSCGAQVGATELYFPSTVSLSQPTSTFQAPTVGGWFGHGVAIVPGSFGNPPMLLVGEGNRSLGTVSNAGQAYVYKKN